MSEPRLRSEVPEEDTWNLETVYPSPSDWEADFEGTSGFAAEFSRRAGTLGSSPEALLGAVREMLDQQRRLEKLYNYASMREDEDLSNPVFSAMSSRMRARMAEVSAAHSFFVPELLSLDASMLENWLERPELAIYASWLREILRRRPHVLSSPEERILAMSSEVTGFFSDSYGKLCNVDMPARLPAILDSEGAETRLTNSNLVPLLESRDPRVRREAFLGYYGELSGNLATAASLLEGHARTQVMHARLRGHPSALEASLFGDDVGKPVYESLIAAVRKSLPLMHRYYALKKRILGLETMRIYDLYLPSVNEPERRYTFEEAAGLTLEAVKLLGDEYADILRTGFASRWVDRYENRGKRSGAYSGGGYDTMPFILHNFTGTLDSVFTLAHEAGHSMHSFMSRRRQPYHTSDYRIILAEVASTLNEILLQELLVGRAESPRARAFLLDRMVNDFRTTVFRQTMFAEFEWMLHREIEEGGALTPGMLSDRYLELVREYHGSAFDLEGDSRLIACEWARIPHFFYNFYVYKYATGLASAVTIARRIIEGRQGALEAYLEFLASGSSRPPLELLAAAGVDLATPEPVGRALAWLDEIVTELEEMENR